MSPFSRQCQNLCLLSLGCIIDWRVVKRSTTITASTNLTRVYPELIRIRGYMAAIDPIYVSVVIMAKKGFIVYT